MSDRRKIRGVSTSLLETRLKAFGINVPDQVRAAHLMKASQHGYSPFDPPHQRWSWLLWLLGPGTRYEVFSVAVHCTIAHEWGGLMPEQVRRTVEGVKEYCPDVVLEVHAHRDDPWLVARSGDESLILHGWYRPNDRAEVNLVF